MTFKFIQKYKSALPANEPLKIFELGLNEYYEVYNIHISGYIYYPYNAAQSHYTHNIFITEDNSALLGSAFINHKTNMPYTMTGKDMYWSLDWNISLHGHEFNKLYLVFTPIGSVITGDITILLSYKEASK